MFVTDLNHHDFTAVAKKHKDYFNFSREDLPISGEVKWCHRYPINIFWGALFCQQFVKHLSIPTWCVSYRQPSTPYHHHTSYPIQILLEWWQLFYRMNLDNLHHGRTKCVSPSGFWSTCELFPALKGLIDSGSGVRREGEVALHIRRRGITHLHR